MGEKAVYSTNAHVFQIDPETKKKWLPSSTSAVRVAFYHDASRKTYRIIAIENNKALVNSTITANMTFTKTSPKFGQWSDHRANTVYGLGFSSEKELQLFVEKFAEATSAAVDVLKQRQNESRRLQDAEMTASSSSSSQSPLQSRPGGSGGPPSPSSPPVRSPNIISPPASSSSKSPSPPSLTSPSSEQDCLDEDAARKISSPSLFNGTSSGGGVGEAPPITNGNSVAQESSDAQLDSLKYENTKLKMALATSATNVKKWESEMQTLKNNNARLTTALEESTQHVQQWKQQLHKYKEENDQLKRKVHELEGSSRSVSVQSLEELAAVRRENEELKEVLSEVQLDLEANAQEGDRKSRELILVRDQLGDAKSRLQVLEDENHMSSGQVAILEDQLKMASVASQRKMSDVHQKHRELGSKFKELLQLHRDMDNLITA